eukprot:6863060-Pyramimonas_sp.AAC.1
MHAAAHAVQSASPAVPPPDTASADEKLNFIMRNMSLKSETATKSDIEAFRVEMKTEIATAVDPLKDE